MGVAEQGMNLKDVFHGFRSTSLVTGKHHGTLGHLCTLCFGCARALRDSIASSAHLMCSGRLCEALTVEH